MRWLPKILIQRARRKRRTEMFCQIRPRIHSIIHQIQILTAFEMSGLEKNGAQKMRKWKTCFQDAAFQV